MKSIPTFSALSCLIIGAALAFVSPQDPQEKSESEKAEMKMAKADADEEATFEPIDNMHHFMEYISQPSYRALKNHLQEKHQLIARAGNRSSRMP